MDIEAIEKAFGYKIFKAEQSKNVCRLETDQGIKSFKKAHIKKEFFYFLYSVVEHLLKKGYEGVVPYNKTVDGDVCIKEGEYIYYCLDWIEGKESKYRNEGELNSVIKAAADFHKASHGYVPPENAEPRILYGRWIERFERKCEELLEFKSIIESKGYIDEFDERFAKDICAYWEQGQQSIELLKKSRYMNISANAEERGEFCHHDMANHNFIITPSGRVYIIDFDYCIMDTRLHDISSLVIRNMKHGVWNIAKAYSVLNEYSRHYNISDEELEVIKAFMVFPQDYWQVGLQYYVEKQPWTMENFLIRLNRVLDDKTMRESFLKEFLNL